MQRPLDKPIPMPDRKSVMREWKWLTDQQKQEILMQFKVKPEDQTEFSKRPGIYILVESMDRRKRHWEFQEQDLSNIVL